MPCVMKEDVLIMLYRACRLYVAACEDTPDWVRIITGTNPDMLMEMLEPATEIAMNDDTYADVVWEDGL